MNEHRVYRHCGLPAQNVQGLRRWNAFRDATIPNWKRRHWRGLRNAFAMEAL